MKQRAHITLHLRLPSELQSATPAFLAPKKRGGAGRKLSVRFIKKEEEQAKLLCSKNMFKKLSVQNKVRVKANENYR